MPKSSQPPRPKKRRNHTGSIVVLLIIIALLIAGIAGMIYLCINITSAPVKVERNDSFISAMLGMLNKQVENIPDISIPNSTSAPSTEPPTEPPTEPETEPPTTMPEPEHVVATATISSTGDVLMHMPVVNSGLRSGGVYDFEPIFRYVKEYTSAADLALANLETTLCGTDNGYSYSGFPNFNCPDEIVDGLADAGFDILLTANNHSYDTGLVGYKRNIETVRDRGLGNLGTMLTAEEPKYLVQNVNGINIGMVCYTYATSVSADGRPSLNGMPQISEQGLCNYFTYDNLPRFYEEVESYIAGMRDSGAEAIVLYIHWGAEYVTFVRDQERAIAQKLCDLGVDVIIGGHPHVIEPIELLTSETDPEHKTVVLYSMGNAVSNQRLGNLSMINTAHTEDGILFNITFSKYSDNTVYLESVDVIPCWVYLRNNKSPVEYNILPLDTSTEDQWIEKYDLSQTTFNAAKLSYNRTMDIVGQGLEASQEYLAAQKEQREADYLAAVMAPAA